MVIAVMPRELGAPRPAVIIQSDLLPTPTSVLLCPLTTELEIVSAARPAVDPSPGNGLQERSKIMTDKIVLSPRERCRKVIGRLGEEDIRALDAAIALVVGLLDAEAPVATDR